MLKKPIVNAQWIKYDGELYLKCWDKDCKPFLYKPKINPYMFIRVSDLDKIQKIKDLIINIECGSYVTADKHRPAVKLEFKFPSDLKKARDILTQMNVPTYESDIPFVRRWLIDERIEIYENPKKIFFDVEADARAGIPMPDRPNQRIISIAAVDDEGNEYFICDDDEKLIFDEFRKLIIGNFAIAVGWGSRRWDVPYLQARARKIKYEFPFRMISWIDLLELFKLSMWGTYSSLKLDDVAKKVLGHGKVTTLYHGGVKQLWEWFLKDRDKLREYNITDAKLLKEIDDRLNLIKGKIMTARMAHVTYDHMPYYMFTVENLVLLKAQQYTPRIVFPYVPQHLEKKETYQGALILTPPKGIFRGVIDLDFTSLYPSILETFNIGPDSAVDPDEKGDYIKSPTGIQFRKYPRSVYAATVTDLKNFRAKLKEIRDSHPYATVEWKHYHVYQQAVKILLTSIYGVLGSPKARRFFDVRVAESVTAYGREILKFAINVCNKLGLKVIYGDTDGIFVLPPQNVNNPTEWAIKNADWLIEEIESRLKPWVIETFNVPEEYYNLHLKVDEIFDKIYFYGVKKRYVGVLPESAKERDIDDYALADVHDVILGGRLGKIIGFEAKKYNVFPLYKNVQLKIFEILMNAESQYEVQLKVSALLRKVRNYLYAGYFDKLLVQTVSPRKHWSEYNSKPPYWESMKEMTEKGLYRPGDAFDYVIVGRKNGKEYGVMVLDENNIPKISREGYDHYWEQLVQMAERVTGLKLTIHTDVLTKWIN